MGSPVVKGDYVKGYSVIGVNESLIKAIFKIDVTFINTQQAYVGQNTPFGKGDN